MDDRALIANFAERTVDNEPEFSFQEVLIKLYRRKWVLVLCVIIPTALGVLVTALTPLTWQATTRILIRYGSSESAFLQDLIPDNRSAISGAVSSEIIRSLPTLEETIRRYDIQDADLYRDPLKVVVSRLFSYLPDVFTHAESTQPPDRATRITQLARTFQQSLDESSKLSAAVGSKTKPIEVLSKDSSIPQAMKGDELITLTVRAFNRGKVAEMTNGLAKTFIDQYYRLSSEDAHRSFEFLSLLESQFTKEIQLLEKDPDAAASTTAGEGQIGGGNGAIARDSPEVNQLTGRLATLEAELGRTQQVYQDNSSNVQRLQAEIANIKRLLPGQERLAVAKQVLQQIQNRRFQARNTEKLYTNRLVPISIVEPAITPEVSAASNVMRFVISGVIGFLIGSVLGLAVVSVFGLVDQRLFTFRDIERSVDLPIFGWLPNLKQPRKRTSYDTIVDANLTQAALPGVLQILAHLDAHRVQGVGQVVAITSTADGDGKSQVSLQLAKAVAKAGLTRVLLVDADPSTASLSRLLGNKPAAGLAEAILAVQPLEDYCQETRIAGLHLLQAGAAANSLALGFHLHRLRHLFNEARELYDLVIVNTASASVDNGAPTCSKIVDVIIVLVKFGVTRRSEIRRFVRHLREVAVAPAGVVLTFREGTLPRLISRNM